jgi:hypothetical protein
MVRLAISVVARQRLLSKDSTPAPEPDIRQDKSRILEDLSFFGISQNAPIVAVCQHLAFDRAYSSSPAGQPLPFVQENDNGKGLPLSRGIRHG